MEKDVRDIELIDGYLEGILSEVELKEVNQRLKSDPDFAALLEEFKLIRKGIELSGMEKQLKKLKEVDMEMGGVESPQSMVDGRQPKTEKNAFPPKENGHLDHERFKRRRLIRMLSVAASVVVLVAAGLWIWRPWQQDLKIDEIQHPYLAEHFDEFILHDVLQSNENKKSNTNRSKAFNLFTIQEFKLALPRLQIEWEQNNDSTSLFYIGITQLALGKIKESDNTFERLDSNPKFKKLLKNIIDEKR